MNDFQHDFQQLIEFQSLTYKNILPMCPMRIVDQAWGCLLPITETAISARNVILRQVAIDLDWDYTIFED